MGQIKTQGNITIIDTTDIESIVVEYARNQSTSTPPTSGWSTTRPAWAQGYYIWQRTRIHKSGTQTSQDTFGDAVCLTGSTGQTGAAGRSLTNMVTQYTTAANSVTITQSNMGQYTWTSNVPTYNSSTPAYWVRVTNTYSNPSSTEYIIYKDNGITDTMATAATANSIAQHAQEDADGALGQASVSIKEIYRVWYRTDSATAPAKPTTHVTQTGNDVTKTWTKNKPIDNANNRYYFYCDETITNGGISSWTEPVLDTSNLSQYEVNALGAKLKNFWWDSNGAHAASGIGGNSVTENTVSTYGYNSLMGVTGFSIGYNAAKVIDLKTTPSPASLDMYQPPSISGTTVTQGAKTVSLSGNTLTFYNPSTGNAQLIIGANGTLQSGNYSRGSDSKFSSNGTKIDLINGDIITKYFRVSQGLESGLTAGVYVHGTIEALDGTIGTDSTNYWEIGNGTDYNLNSTAKMIGHGSSYIQLGDSSTWRLATNRIHTGWYISSDSLLHFPAIDSKYWDFGVHTPTASAEKFLYIRKSKANTSASNALTNLLYDIDDSYATSQWDYVFYVSANGSLYAKNLYVLDDNGNAIQIGGTDGVYLLKSGGTITGNLEVNGTLTKGGKTVTYLTTTPTSGQILVADGTSGSIKTSGYTIATSVPSGALFTDKNVQTSQANTTKIYLAGTPTTGTATGTLNYDSNVYLTTTAGTLHATTFEGNLSGTATKANQDGDGNVIKNTYLKLSGGQVTGPVSFGDSVSMDEATVGNLIVNGAGRFTNGLYGNLTGNADSATIAGGVADVGNGTNTTFAYSKSGLTTTSWVAAWSGYELRAISPANLLTTIGGVAKSGDTMTGTLTAPEFSLSGGVNNTTAGFRLTNNGTNMDMGWTWTGAQGAGACFTSSSHPNQPGIFDFFARAKNSSNQEVTKHLIGSISGALTWDNRRVVTATNSTAVGGTSTPVYIDANGYAQACTSISATKFSSAKTIQLTGDVTGSTSGDGSSGWSITTTVADDSHNHTEFTLVPKISKTYASTSYYASTTSNHDTATWYFISVKPDSWYKPWKIKLKIRSFCPSYTNIDSITESTIWGRADSITYSNYTEKYDNGHYYIGVRALKKAGFDAGYSHAVGVDILWATNYATSAYYRTFELDYYYCENCTVTVLDTPLLWGNWSGGTGTNYNNISALDAVTRGYTETGDRNEIYAMGLRNYNTAYIKGAITSESVIVGDVSGYQQVASGVSFDTTYPILWSTGTLAVGATNYANLYTQIYDRSITNIKSGFTSAANKVIYLVVTMSGKTATIDSAVITDTLPSTDDGKVYIAIGRMGNNSNGQNYFFFWQNKPMYWYKNGAVRLYGGDAATVQGKTPLFTHQDISGKADKSATVSTITYDSTNNKITKTINGTTTDVVTVATIKNAIGSLKNPNALKINVYSGTSTAATTTYDGSTANQSVDVASSAAITNVSASAAAGGSTTFTLTKANGATSTFDVTVTASVATGATTITDANGNAVSKGNTTTPVYFSSGIPAEANIYAGGTAVTLNGSNKGSSTASFYAPTTAGTSGQVLTSSGGAPGWTNQSSLSVGSATKATQDSDGSVINTTYLKLAGGKLTGGLEITGHVNCANGSASNLAWTWGGGGYHNAYNNIVLHGDATTGSSGIAFVSDKGDTNINAPSDRAFIQFHAYGITTATAEGTNPTLATSGEANRLVIGVGNDVTDEIWLQTPAVYGLRHQVGATTYTIPSLSATTTTANYPLISTTTAGLYSQNTSITMNGGTITATTFSGALSGNATTATKFSSNRTIKLTGDVTGEVSSTGESGWSITTTVADSSHNHIPNNIVFNNMGLANSIDPITRAYIGAAMSNKTFGLPANAIVIEYSTNGGSTWIDYGATDYHKKNLFAETRTGCGTYLGKATTKEANSVNNQLRITIEPTDRYVGLDALYVWMTTNGNTVFVDLERSTIGAKDTFTTVFTNQQLGGWSGNNIRYFPYAAFGGGTTQTSNCYKYRLTFKQTAISSDYPSANIYDIRFLGGSWHSSSISMVQRNHLYSWDGDLNATFPANITATTFNGSLNGNASTATSAINAAEATDANKLKYQSTLSTDDAIDGFLEANRFKTALWGTTSSPGVANGIILSGGYSSTTYGFQLAIDDDPTYFMALRQKNGSGWGAWKRIPMADGTGASGTWGIGISGNATTATTASFANNLWAYAGNEVTIGANNTTAGESTNNAVYINYRDVYGGTTTNNATQLTTYYFGNRKGGVTGVTVYAETFNGNATSATKATQDGSGNTITSTYIKKAGDTMTGGLTVEASNSYSSYNEGIRINAGARTYATLLMGGTNGTTSGTNDGAFWIGVYNTSSYARRLMIAHNGSTGTNTYFYSNAAGTVSPWLHLGNSGTITSGNADAVTGGTVYTALGNYVTLNSAQTLTAAATKTYLGLQTYGSNGIAFGSTDGSTVIQKANMRYDSTLEAIVFSFS